MTNIDKNQKRGIQIFCNIKNIVGDEFNFLC